MKSDVFTPLNEAQTIRGNFPIKDVEILSGELGLRRRGCKAIVRIHGKTYKVMGKSCGLPHCMCDAYLKEIYEPVAV
jgi:hypothetical protein